MRTSTRILLIGILVLTLTAACCPFEQEEGTKVRIAFFPNITHVQALLGKADGTFQQMLGPDREIEWKMFNAGPAEIEALFAGEVDIGYIGPVPAINAYLKSRGDISIIAGAVQGGAILVTRPDIEINTVADLDGRKVGIPQLGNTQDICLRYLLGQQGMEDAANGGTVQIVQVQNSDLRVLLERRQIDAALVPEPWGSLLVEEIKAKVVLDYDEIFREGKYPATVVVVRNDFLKEHPEIVADFIEAHLKLTAYVNENPNLAMAVSNAEIARLTGKSLTENIMQTAFSRMVVTHDPGEAAIFELSMLAYDLGVFKEKPDLGEIFDLEFLRAELRNKALLD